MDNKDKQILRAVTVATFLPATFGTFFYHHFKK